MATWREVKRRAKIRRALYAKPTIAVLIILVFIASRAAYGVFEKSRDADARRDRAVAEVEALERRATELEASVARLSTERGVEEEIRDRFMVAKEGEKVIIVTEPAEKDEVHMVVVPEGEKKPVESLLQSVGLEQ